MSRVMVFGMDNIGEIVLLYDSASNQLCPTSNPVRAFVALER
jgi:hypothetical protein